MNIGMDGIKKNTLSVFVKFSKNFLLLSLLVPIGTTSWKGSHDDCDNEDSDDGGDDDIDYDDSDGDDNSVDDYKSDIKHLRCFCKLRNLSFCSLGS